MFNPQERSHPIIFLACVFVACWLLCGIAIAAPFITLSKKSGPPTSGILVSGRGFEPNVGVDIFFDTKDKALLVTNGKGEFHDARIFAPRSAYPGQHWVTALERNNDKGAQEPFLVQTNWSQFLFDADGTRLNPYENVLNSRTVRSLDLKWSYATGYSVRSSPAVSNGVVYVGGEDAKVHALNASTGAELWNYNINCCYVDSSPAVADGVVYVGDQGGAVLALDARTGVLLWKIQTEASVPSAPAVANGVVYVGGYQNVYALHAHTGAQVWSYYSGNDYYSSPAVVNGVVYVGDTIQDQGGGAVLALDATTGAKLWTYATAGAVNSAPAVANGGVYVGSIYPDYKVYALNASTGSLLWSYLTGNEVYSSPAVANGVVYIGSNDGNLYALDASTGAKLWTYTVGVVNSESPAVANGVVYIGSEDNYLNALNARTGALLWRYSGFVDSSPTVANGVVYVGSVDWNVYAFGLKHGQEQAGAASKPPPLNTLHPDFNLKPSKPV